MQIITERLAIAGFKIGAIKIDAEKPFPWASGTYNPIYNDNRMFLFHPEYRELCVDGFELLYRNSSFMNTFMEPSVIAGTSTAGIAPGVLLANRLNLPFIYVRDKPKDHGLKNQIEGIDNSKSLDGVCVLLIEDLISVGGSSASAVDAIRKANGKIQSCFSIFNYNLPKSKQVFAGEIPFNVSGATLDKPCGVTSLLNYSKLIETGIKNGFIKPEKEEMLKAWMNNQENWGDEHGYPHEKK